MKRILAACGIAAAALATQSPAFAQELGPAVLENPSDVRLQADINDRLVVDHRMDGAMFTVSVHDGHVSVTGTLKDQAQEAEIYRVAHSIDGVRDVFVFAEEDSQ
jgi:osmotically-inducible protein OsmY